MSYKRKFFLFERALSFDTVINFRLDLKLYFFVFFMGNMLQHTSYYIDSMTISSLIAGLFTALCQINSFSHLTLNSLYRLDTNITKP